MRGYIQMTNDAVCLRQGWDRNNQWWHTEWKDNCRHSNHKQNRWHERKNMLGRHQKKMNMCLKDRNPLMTLNRSLQLWHQTRFRLSPKQTKKCSRRKVLALFVTPLDVVFLRRYFSSLKIDRINRLNSRI